jgi:hypothetical protein
MKLRLNILVLPFSSDRNITGAHIHVCDQKHEILLIFHNMCNLQYTSHAHQILETKLRNILDEKDSQDKSRS